jgi:nuclear pore complex protein Nup205
MADVTTLDALQAFHQELVAVLERRADAAETLGNDVLVEAFEKELGNLWSPPPKSEKSRSSLKSGAIVSAD